MTSTARLASLGICMTERKPKPKEIPLTAKRKKKTKSGVVSYRFSRSGFSWFFLLLCRLARLPCCRSLSPRNIYSLGCLRISSQFASKRRFQSRTDCMNFSVFSSSRSRPNIVSTNSMPDC